MPIDLLLNYFPPKPLHACREYGIQSDIVTLIEEILNVIVKHEEITKKFFSLKTKLVSSKINVYNF